MWSISRGHWDFGHDGQLQAEVAVQQLKQFESVSPPIVKQVLPLNEQLPPLYADLANGKDQFVPTPDETDRLVSMSKSLDLVWCKYPPKSVLGALHLLHKLIGF
jgi:hypothetical protein